MMLTCEKCQTKYMVKPESIAASGRSVKCVKCGHTWKQYPEGVTPPGKIDPIPETLRAIPKGGALPVIQGSHVSFGLKFATAALFLLTFVVTAILYQQPILHRVPALSPIYTKIGLPETRGLTLHDLSVGDTSPADGEKLYVLKGKLTNRSAKQRALPSLKISILDGNRTTLESFILKSSGEPIAPGKTINFSNKLSNMPEKSNYLVIDIGNRTELMLR